MRGASAKRGLPSTPSMRRLVIVKGGVRNFPADGMFDRASIRTRLASTDAVLYEVRSHDAALSVSASRAGRGLAVAANSVCPLRCCDS